MQKINTKLQNEEIIRKHIGKRLTFLQGELRPTEFATLLGLSYRMLYKYKNGEIMPSILVLLHFSNICGVEIGYFFRGIKHYFTEYL